jgi:flavin reductase (DIM6/NTAB) family NADH-FMN oxidoreductase RutF
VKSGKDVDKIKESGITPIPSLKVEAPGFDEAELIIECRKIYFDDFHPKHFLDVSIDGNYPERDYHRVYLGEIVTINGIGKYLDEK